MTERQRERERERQRETEWWGKKENKFDMDAPRSNGYNTCTSIYKRKFNAWKQVNILLRLVQNRITCLTIDMPKCFIRPYFLKRIIYEYHGISTCTFLNFLDIMGTVTGQL